MTRMTMLAAVAGMAMVAGVAQATPAPGTYSGTAADGSNISFVVGTDANNSLAITSMQLGLTAVCHPGSYTFGTGWGVGADVPVDSNTVSVLLNYQYISIKAAIKFNNGTATGTESSVTPSFQPTTKPQPTAAGFCKSAPQSFTATLQTGGGGTASALRPGMAMTMPVRK